MANGSLSIRARHSPSRVPIEERSGVSAATRPTPWPGVVAVPFNLLGQRGDEVRRQLLVAMMFGLERAASATDRAEVDCVADDLSGRDERIDRAVVAVVGAVADDMAAAGVEIAEHLAVVAGGDVHADRAHGFEDFDAHLGDRLSQRE